ncbi:MAG: Gfo/Idh/MocA family oxidoreductase, partial [Planctomycetota bacterium]|nr:Gfo/Idh/MocA family oxidoreductase [Planctomycetota bacterium]
MADTPVRLGYVGCGFVAQRIHIPDFVALPECRLLAIAEVRKDLGDRVAKRYDIPKVYRSHKELAADPEIEAVGVSGPYSLQGHIAEDLLSAGKHVFMEKPCCVDAPGFRSLMESNKLAD